MKKRILALLLIFCMVLTMLPVQIFAEANTTGEVMGSFKLEIVPVEKKTVYNLDKEASFNLYLSAGEDATADFAIIRSLQADITGVDFTLTDVTTAHGQAGVLPEEATIVFLAGDDTDPLILFNGEKLLIGTVTGKVENTTFSVKGTAEVAEGPTTFTNTEEYAYYGTVGPQLIPVSKPTAVEEALIYNGQEQTGVIYDPNSEAYSVDYEPSATAAGLHYARFTLKDGYVWEGGDTEPFGIEWWIAKAPPITIIPEPGQSKFKDVDYEIKYHYDGELFDGDDFEGTLGIEDEHVGDCAITIGDLMIVGANGVDNYDISIANETIEVKKNTVAKPTAVEEALIYNGQEQTGVDYDPNCEAYSVDGETSAVGAGQHSATFTLKDGCVWDDGDEERTCEVDWEIKKAPMLIIPEPRQSKIKDVDYEIKYHYDGELFDGDDFVGTLGIEDEQVGDCAITIGDLMIVGANGADNYDISIAYGTIEVKKNTVAQPTAIEGLIYNGQEQTGVDFDPNSEAYEVSFQTSATAAGPHTATFTLNEGYVWEGGDGEPVEIEWSIAKAKLTVTADNKEVIFGDDAPDYTVRYDGFVNGEDESVITTGCTAVCDYEPGSVYQELYNITVDTSRFEADNYEIGTTKKGTLTVREIDVYTVTYDANGGEGAPAQQRKFYGKPLTLSEAVPTRKGYTFLGWAETSDATEAVYQPGESYVADESVTLYALWKKDDIIGTTGEVSWKLDENGTLTVFGEGYMADALSEQGVSWLPYRESIRRAVIGSGVKNIGAYAFYDCTNLTGVKICDTVTYVGNMAFKGCTKLYQIALPDSVTNVGNGAFAASGLRQAALGSGLTEIGDDAFWGCTYLNCVMIPGSVTDIGENAFYNANPRIIYFDGDLDQWQTIYNKSEIFSHAVEYYKNDKVLNGSCGEFSSYSLTVGSGRLTLSGSGRADGIAWRIGENYYGNIPRLIVTVEDEITAIGTGSFRNLPVTAITIGRGVKTIEDGAFEGYNQLADVYYNGTEAQWNEIAVGTDNEDLLSAAIHFSDERRIEAGETVRLDESTQQKLILDGGTLILGEGVEATVEAYSGTLVLKDGAVATLNDVLDLQIVDESNYSKETDTFLGGEAVVKLGEEVSAVTLCGLCNYDDTQMAVLPLYDAEKDGYRLFKTEFDQRTPISVGSNGYKFRFRPIFLNEDGFTLFKQQDSSVDVCFELRYNGEQFFIDPSDSGIYTFGTDLRNQFCDKHSTTLYYISVSGLKDGDTFEVLPCFLFNGCKVCQNEIVATK